MKKYLLLAISSLCLVASSAYADTESTVDDVTLLGTLQPGQSKSKTFNLVKGKNTITVFSDDDDAVFTCKFINEDNGTEVLQSHVENCKGIVKYSSSIVLNIIITNETNKTIDYRTALHHEIKF